MIDASWLELLTDVGERSGLSRLHATGVLQYPLDQILIYGTSLFVVVPFVFKMLAVHHLTDTDKQFRTHGALIFTIFYVVFVTANYVVQIVHKPGAREFADKFGRPDTPPGWKDA